MKRKKKIPLYLQILIGMLSGIIVGFVALELKGGHFIVNWIKPWGDIFIRLLQLVAIPLVFVSLIKGVIGLKDIGTLSRLGGKTIVIYLLTTVFAIMIGLSLALLVKPGAIFDTNMVDFLEGEYQETVAQAVAATQESRGPLAFLYEVIPDNIFGALSNNRKMLQIIFFALFFGVATLSIGNERNKPVVRLVDSVYDVILKMIDWAILTAPIGVFALMAGLIVSFSGDIKLFGALGLYAVTVIVGLLFLIFIFYPVLIKLFTTTPVRRFLKNIYPVQLLAFSTSSSAATLPLTMEVAEKDMRISKETASFVLPVGVTINMDGTSCFQTISVIFIAQVLGLDLTVAQILTIILMTTISSIGTPGVPGGSYVILTMVLTSVGIPAEGMALILGVDRPLDMLRTAVNVTGDMTVALMVDEKGIEKQIPNFSAQPLDR